MFLNVTSKNLFGCSKEARKGLQEERQGISTSTLNALISLKWKVLLHFLSLNLILLYTSLPLYISLRLTNLAIGTE